MRTTRERYAWDRAQLERDPRWIQYLNGERYRLAEPGIEDEAELERLVESVLGEDGFDVDPEDNR